MEIYIIRHTPVEVESGTCYGQSDVDLNDQLDHYQSIYAKELPQDFDAVFTSPLKRCVQLTEKLGFVNYETDHRLMEMNFGDWELKKWNDIPFEESNPWMENFVNVATPNGESMLDLYHRINTFYEDLKNRNFKKVLIVSHAGPIRCFWSIILQIPLINLFKIPVGFGEILCIESKYNTIKRKA